MFLKHLNSKLLSYVGKMIKKIDLAYISSLALDYLDEAEKARQKGNREEQISSLSIAYAFNKLQKYEDGINMFTRFMESIVKDRKELEKWYEFGDVMARAILLKLLPTLTESLIPNRNLIVRVLEAKLN